LISSLGPFQPPAWKQAPLVSADRLDPFLSIVVIGTGLFAFASRLTTIFKLFRINLGQLPGLLFDFSYPEIKFSGRIASAE
jgi:hypothetical protein